MRDLFRDAGEIHLAGISLATDTTIAFGSPEHAVRLASTLTRMTSGAELDVERIEAALEEVRDQLQEVTEAVAPGSTGAIPDDLAVGRD